MIITDKIVTLSYGPFSCSLQGFDNKFDILEPIAEYFCDLLIKAPQGSNRLPVSNADDLARIVGDVISHPVEGYEAQGVIILKPSEMSLDAAMADEDIEGIYDQDALAADPVELLTTHEAEALKAPARDTELAEGGNIFDEEDAWGEDAGGNESTDPDAEDSAGREEAPVPIVQPSRIGRVIKMKRRDFDAAISGGVIEEDMEAPEDAADQSAAQSAAQSVDQSAGNMRGPGLSLESEADLQRQLAKARATPKDQGDTVIPTMPKAMGWHKGVDRLHSSERRTDLERMFDEVDSQLDKSHSRDRHNAIQHLRAAVAAARAEGPAGHKLGQVIDETPYREDLAEAVDAKAVPHKFSRVRRRKISILPPLKLAADQRIDTDKI